MNDIHNGRADAFKHCLGSCDITRMYGILAATVLGNLHEIQGEIAGQPFTEFSMDYWNNGVGRYIAQSDDPQSFDDCANGCQWCVEHNWTINSLDDPRIGQQADGWWPFPWALW